MPYQGPFSPGTIADDSSIGALTWSNPSNAGASDNTYASFSGNDNSHYLKATNFGFSIPGGAVISGIVIEVEMKKASGGGLENSIKLVKGGTIGGTDHATFDALPTTDTYKAYGASNDLWGQTLTSSDINASDFGVALSFFTSGQFDVDHIRIYVFYDHENWKTRKGFNFRNTANYVIDDSNETYVLTTTAYPTMRIIGDDAVKFGWQAAPGSSLDVLSTVDRRLAGYGEYSSARTFRIDLPAHGEYDVWIAAGLCDQSGQNQDPWQEVRIDDGPDAVQRFKIGPHSAQGGNFYDAQDQLLTTAQWPSQNLPKRIISTGGYIVFVFLTDSSTHSFYFAHISLQLVRDFGLKVTHE